MSKFKFNAIPLITTSIIAGFYFPIVIMGQSLAENKNPTPETTGKPDTEPSGRRTADCIAGEKRLTALIPKTERKIGLTVTADPTLFFYVPSRGITAETIEFILKDNNENTRYQTTLPVPKDPGIISLKIPRSAKLQLGNSYRWTFSLICQTRSRDDDIYVNGIIQRVGLTPELTAQLAEAESREIPTIYANAGIWHETLSSLAQLRQDNPQDQALTDDWVRMLESVGLGDIAEEPLIEP